MGFPWDALDVAAVLFILGCVAMGAAVLILAWRRSSRPRRRWKAEGY